jgi:hypothetical protein
MTVRWGGASGTVYRIESTPDLVVTNWTVLGVVTAEWPVVSFVDTSPAPAGRRFYRVTPLP